LLNKLVFLKMSFWKFFDGIFCINLISRNDRYVSSKKIFQDLRINPTYFRPKKHPNGGLQGCFESHIHLIKTAYDKGFNNILIFEDDLYLNSKADLSKYMNKAIIFMKNNTWDLFYFGPIHDIRFHTTEPTRDPSIFKVHNLCTHAYAINRPMMEKLKDMKYFGVPIDTLYSFSDKAYSIHPIIFYQGLSAGDIGTGGYYWFTNYPRLTRMYWDLVQWYAYNINIALLKPNTIFFIIGCIIFILLLKFFVSKYSLK